MMNIKLKPLNRVIYSKYLKVSSFNNISIAQPFWYVASTSTAGLSGDSGRGDN